MHVETYLIVDISSSAQVKIRISNFLKQNQIFGFPWCSTREDFSIDVPIANVGLISTKPEWFFFFWGGGGTDGQTDTVLESSYGNMSAYKNFNSRLKISG